MEQAKELLNITESPSEASGELSNNLFDFSEYRLPILLCCATTLDWISFRKGLTSTVPHGSSKYYILSTFYFHNYLYECMVSLFHRESYELGRDCPSLGAVKQARTLRLLANTFLDLGGEGQWQKALNAVSLANSEHSHPAGFLLKTSILLQHDSGNERLAQCETEYSITVERFHKVCIQ